MRTIIAALLLLSCNKSSLLEIKALPSQFYYSNQDPINKAIELVRSNCKPKNEIALNLKFDYLPHELINLGPDKIGMTSFFSDVTYIETNIYKFAYFNETERFVYLLHEIGHSIGLEHVDDSTSVMFKDNSMNANIDEFKKMVARHCSNLIDVPRKATY